MAGSGGSDDIVERVSQPRFFSVSRSLKQALSGWMEKWSSLAYVTVTTLEGKTLSASMLNSLPKWALNDLARGKSPQLGPSLIPSPSTGSHGVR